MHVRALQLGRQQEHARHDALTLSWEPEIHVNALSYPWAGLIRQTGERCSERATDNVYCRVLGNSICLKLY